MAEKHFFEQKQFTRNFLLPYFQSYIKNFHKCKVLEVGCAEGGLMEVLGEIGMKVKGVEISQERVDIAKSKNPALDIIVGDITNRNLPEQVGEKFDMIIMREVIEHVPDKNSAFDNLFDLLNENGYLFISFPPKYSPFAGHQQIAKSFLKMFPYLHLFPKIILKPLAKNLGEKPDYIEEIKMHYSTGCSVNQVYYQIKRKNFVIIRKDFYFFRPIYKQRFGVPIIKLPEVPILKEFISFGCECLLKKG